MTETNPIVVKPWTPHAGYRTSEEETEESTSSGIGGTAPPGTETISPTPPPDYEPTVGPVAPRPISISPTPPPLVQPPITSPPITSDPLPSVPTPSISETSTTTVAPPPTPIFKETDEGTVITNLAEVKAYNRQYNDAVDALAPYKVGNSYDITKIAMSDKPNVISSAKLLLGVTSSDLKDAQSVFATTEKEQYASMKGLTPKEYADKVQGYRTQGLTPTQIDEKMLNYYIEPQPVEASIYANMGDKARQYYYPKLSIWESLTPWKEEEGQTASIGGVGLMGAELLIPGVYTARHWGELNSGWKAGSIILDLAAFVPMVNIASGLGRSGIGTARVLGRTAMMEIKAPITQVLHPVSTAKAIVAPWEAMLRPKALPIAAVELRRSPVTMAIPWEEIGRSPQSAMMSRDILTGLALEGKGASIQVATEAGMRNVALTPTALQKTIGASVVHTGPDMRAFMGGATIHTGREGGMFVSPSLHSNFVYASAFGDLPKGGIPGALIIRDPKILASLKPSNKVYRGLTEIEKLLQAGEKLPAPSQILMTRDVSGQKIALLIIGEPLSKGQITKLKFLGAKDTIRDIFAPAYKTKGVSGMMDEVIELNQKLTKLEKDLLVAKKAKNTVRVTELKSEIATVRKNIERITNDIRPRATSPRSLGVVGLGQGEFITESVYNEYARYDPARFSRFMDSLPRRTRVEIERQLSDRNRARVNKELDRIRVDRRYDDRPTRIERLWSPRVSLRRNDRRPNIRINRIYRDRTFRADDYHIPRVGKGKATGATVLLPKPPDSGDKQRRRFPMDSFAWKQGFGWWVSMPPYSGTIGKDMIFTRTKPAGVPIGRTPKETVTKLGINVPKGNIVDLGIMDVHLGNKGKTIKYTKDRRQKTKQGKVIGMPPGIVGARGR